MKMLKIEYDKQRFPIREKFESIFKIDDLSSISDSVEVFRRENDQDTKWHKIYYEWARTDEFTDLYMDFIKEVIRPLYDEPIVYQAIPTFRIAYPKNIAVGEFHKDKNYRNHEWAEFVREENYFLPVTDAFDTNTIWVESEEDVGDFAPMNCEYGKVIRWDGSNLTHGNKINETGKCRISFDFRVIKLSNYKPSNHESINTHMKFQIGAYYKCI